MRQLINNVFATSTIHLKNIQTEGKVYTPSVMLPL